MGLKTKLGDEVGQELIEDSFCGIEGLRNVAVSVEEVLHCILLERTAIVGKVLTLLIREVLLSSILSDSSSRLH